MKTMKAIGLTAFLALALMGSSCSGDDGGENKGSGMATYIFATIDGHSFKTFELQGFLSAQATKNGNTVSIIGVAEDDSGMTIGLTGITEPGIYPISSNAIANRIGYSDSDVTISSLSPCEGVEGTIKISVINDTKVEGTFTMTANNSECTQERTVTNGSFRGTFTNN
jgi:hypothetical protein